MTPRPATTRTGPALPAVAGLDPLSMTVTPMSVRCDYQMSGRGHRMLGWLRGQQVIDTGWHPTPSKATTAFGRALTALARDNAARYTIR